jgi:uncharacterized membrane protein YfbV (UPF0208 family)
MKSVADWIRSGTPGWTDEQRYETLTFWHKLLQPGIIVGFVVGGPILRFCILILHSIVIVTQIAYRDCLIRRVEREFSNKRISSFAAYFFEIIGLNTLTKTERMMLSAGTNIGLLVMFIILLLQESVLWMVGFAAIVFTVPPILVWFSTVLPPLKNDEQPLKNDHAVRASPSSSQTLPRVSGKTKPIDETE